MPGVRSAYDSKNQPTEGGTTNRNPAVQLRELTAAAARCPFCSGEPDPTDLKRIRPLHERSCPAGGGTVNGNRHGRLPGRGGSADGGAGAREVQRVAPPVRWNDRVSS
jgi:hypothetical protein